MPAVADLNQSGDPYIDGILGDMKWAVNKFTYSFPTAGSFYGPSYGDGENITGFAALGVAQQAMVRSALTMYASVANISFTEMAETSAAHADLRFALSDLPGTAWGYFTTAGAEGGDAWFNRSSGNYSQPVKGNYAYLTFVHEIGHTLGLEHPHESGMPVDRDSVEYTVMSYRSYVGASTTAGYVNEDWGFAQSLMMYDIAALQQMYGANYGTNRSDTTYSWSPTTGEMFINGIGQGAPGGNRILLTVWDGGGNDTYDFSNYAGNLKVDLQPGGWTTTSVSQLARLRYDGSKLAAGNIANALLYMGDTHSLIENAIGGSGNDTIVGNAVANTLKGGTGNDTLTGGGGDDLLDGGAGSDTVVLSGQRSDYDLVPLAGGSLQVVDLRAGATDGKDIVSNVEVIKFSDKVYAVSDLIGSERKVVSDVSVAPVTPVATDTPAAPDLILTGTNAAERLSGGEGNDQINGLSGNDALYGLDGNDVLIGGAGRDILDGGLGSDTVSYATAVAGLVADLSTGSRNTRDASGDTYRSIENLTGSSHADSLGGNGAANQLKGGAGSDLLYGRGGADRVDGQDGNDYLDGGSAGDALDGGNGNDTLYGGSGADVLFGGAGKDVFIFRSVADSTAHTRDVIQDFVSGQDKIDLRNMDANTKLLWDQAFSYIGDHAFTGKPGQLSFSHGVLSGDVNGDKVPDFQISVSGISALKATDFYL